MLNLASKTHDDWAPRQIGALDHLLVEQAQLEKKAAAGALQYMFRYPDRVAMQGALSAIAREELEHFELVLAELERRGLALTRQKPGPYAGELLRIVRPTEPEKFLDHLLCNAAVEARSCERMRLLAQALEPQDPAAASLYAGLVASEARHHALYVDLAKSEFDEAVVLGRLAEVMAHEADVIASVPEQPGLHSRG